MQHRKRDGTLFSPEYYEKIEKHSIAQDTGFGVRDERDSNDHKPVGMRKDGFVNSGLIKDQRFIAEAVTWSRILNPNSQTILDYGSGYHRHNWLGVTHTEESWTGPKEGRQGYRSRPGSDTDLVRIKDVPNDHYGGFYEYNDELRPPKGQSFISFFDFIGVNKQEDYTAWDPTVKGLDFKLPHGARWDTTICQDVLEHVPEVDVPDVIEDLVYRTNSCLFIMVSCNPGRQMFIKGYDKGVKIKDLDESNYDGEIHSCVKDPKWWVDVLKTASNKVMKYRSNPMVIKMAMKGIYPEGSDKSDRKEVISFANSKNIPHKEHAKHLYELLPRFGTVLWPIQYCKFYDESTVIPELHKRERVTKIAQDRKDGGFSIHIPNRYYVYDHKYMKTKAMNESFQSAEYMNRALNDRNVNNPISKSQEDWSFDMVKKPKVQVEFEHSSLKKDKPKTKKDYDFSRQPKPSNNSEWPKKPAYTPRRGHEKWVKIPQKKDEANVIFWKKTDANKINEKQHKKIDRWRV